MIIQSKAPFRISFGGGGTDVPPYCWEHCGAVVSTTIDKYAYATLRSNNTEKINVRSINFNLNESFKLNRLEYDGCLDWVKAVVNEFEIKEGFDLVIHGEMPPASGMGTSSSVVVALMGCLKEFIGRSMSKEEIAELAYHIEREELGKKGGYQDQYATTFGGFNYIEFYKRKVRVNPLQLSRKILNDLEHRLLLFYTGKTRLSGEIHKDIARHYEEKMKAHLEGLHNLKRVADDMKRCLLNEDINWFGELLHDGWVHKRKLSSRIVTSKIDKLYEIARKSGAVGGKILGAGGGGHLLFFCEPERRFEVIHKLNEYGGKLVPFGFESKGLQTWEFKNGKNEKN